MLLIQCYYLLHKTSKYITKNIKFSHCLKFKKIFDHSYTSFIANLFNDQENEIAGGKGRK